MSNHKYAGLKITQQPGAPAFFLTAVPARELLKWCDVPRAKGDYMAGYQRALNGKRSAALKDYIALSPQNIVPGAIIVAVDQDHVTVTESGELTQLTIDEDTRDFKTRLEELFGSFTSRLSSEELSSANIEFSASDWAESADDDDDDDDEQNPTSYMALLAKELDAAVKGWDKLPPERQTAIKEFIDGHSKPGLIIDGQHRVFGASQVEHEVMLPIVLLPGLAYAEQVFQFYVLNSKAKPLRPTELRRIVSTTLTNQEIDQLYGRFKQAGVAAEEARWTNDLNERPDSPFRNRINFGYAQPGAIIQENVADQLVRAFMKMPVKRYQQLTKPLGGQWEDEDSRLDIFFWLWGAVKTQYADAWAEAEAAADKGNQHNLFLKVTLLTLQKFLLDRFVIVLPFRGPDAPSPLSSKREVQQMVASTLKNLPPAFFQREWKMKQIDTTGGRKELLNAMDAVWSNQGVVHGNMKLFKG